MSLTKKTTITETTKVYTVTIGLRDAAGVPNTRLFVFRDRGDALKAYRIEEDELLKKLDTNQVYQINTYYANRAFCGAYEDDATFVKLEEKEIINSYEAGAKMISNFKEALK